MDSKEISSMEAAEAAHREACILELVNKWLSAVTFFMGYFQTVEPHTVQSLVDRAACVIDALHSAKIPEKTYYGRETGERAEEEKVPEGVVVHGLSGTDA